MEITKEIAVHVLNLVDHGLSLGLGEPTPGKMCVEAAVCFALGEIHNGDRPSCVSPCLRTFEIELNDARWSSNEARAKGLRRIAIAQLGTMGTLDITLLAKKLETAVIGKLLPRVLRTAAASQEEHGKCELLQAAIRCETDPSADAAGAAEAAASAFAPDYAAYAHYCVPRKFASDYRAVGELGDIVASVAEAADAADRDLWLSDFAEDVVQILVEIKTPGSKYLFLTESAI